MSEETKQGSAEQPVQEAGAAAVMPKVYGLSIDLWAGRLQYALDLLYEANQKSEVFGEKRYTTVADRLSCFRLAFGPLAEVSTEIIEVDEQVVRAKCVIGFLLPSGATFVAATGHAEEWRDSSDINMTSALENAETSAVGRALANLGIHGGEFATAEEVIAARRELERLKSREATSFLKPEEVTNAVALINACKTESELAETYMKFNPALKVATGPAKDVKLRSLSAPTSGSAVEKDVSQAAPSEQPSESARRRARSSGAA